MNIGEIRQKFPQYADVPDGQLVRGLHKTYYADMPYEKFIGTIDFTGSFADPGKVKAPTEDMSGTERFLAGAGKAFVDAGRGVKQIAAGAADLVAPRGNLSSLVTGKDNSRYAEVTRDVIQSRDLDRDLMDTGAGVAGDIVGNVAMALAPGGALKGAATVASKLPATARVAEALNAAGNTMLAPKSLKSAAAVGGGIGAVQPAGDATERITNTLLAGGISGAAQAAPRALGRVVAPNTRPEARALIDEGVSLTPGQIMGGTAQRVEDGLTSVPVLGDAIKGAQRRGIESFDTAAINRALEPLGQKLPAGLKGHEAVAHAKQALGDAYDGLLPKLKGELDAAPAVNALPAQAGQSAKPTLRHELDQIRQLGANLPEQQAGQLDRIIENEVVKRFTPQGLAAGETLKNIESKLGGLAKDFGRSENYDVRTLGDAVQEVQAALRRMVEQVNPGYGKELAAINSGYANFKRVERAASSVGAKDGVFTPAQLHGAAKAGDRSKDKARFAVGEALMQDLSSAGKSALSSTVPDSGTPFRLANMATMGGGYMLDPLVAGGTLGAAGAYSAPIQKVIQALLVERPELMRQLGPKIAGSAPYLTGASLPAVGVINANQ